MKVSVNYFIVYKLNRNTTIKNMPYAPRMQEKKSGHLGW